MDLIIPSDGIAAAGRARAGGKAVALAALAAAGFRVPGVIVVSTEAYRWYVSETGLRERILLELNRKDFADLRWEEMWDAALRIRSMFLNTPLPAALAAELAGPLEERFAGTPVAVRSSAPGEDAANTSFAGLHESYLNVRGVPRILDHIRLVWASLWSDRALLYRQELHLAIATSRMAVVVQELVPGERSGVVFGRNPLDPAQAVIEAVYGLNEGLVDGTVEPDRWIMDRTTGVVVSHTQPVRDKAVLLAASGTQVAVLDPAQCRDPPLTASEVSAILELARRGEACFGAPQDVEWTFHAGQLYTLQARPITTASHPDDKRTWYVSLTRSFENLKTLRRQIECDRIPAMAAEAARLAAADLDTLSDAGLAREIERRAASFRDWTAVYWEEFIPFAHGTRLFGQVYNDALRPDDPYEFTELLTGSDMVSLERNRQLATMAERLRQDPGLAQALELGQNTAIPAEFQGQMATFGSRYGAGLGWGNDGTRGWQTLSRLLLEMARHGTTAEKAATTKAAKAERFLASFNPAERQRATDLLDLARASYRLRDDDNIHLGRIEQELQRAVALGRGRLEVQRGRVDERLAPADIAKALADPDSELATVPPASATEPASPLRARQLIGQPAGPGLATGRARVIPAGAPLDDFHRGDVLICDAVDPNMTFVVPLAAAVVERRGGMLIHGAIIAREYGLPCVTGVPDATAQIPDGAVVTVDGYLGVVTVVQR